MLTADEEFVQGYVDLRGEISSIMQRQRANVVVLFLRSVRNVVRIV